MQMREAVTKFFRCLRQVLTLRRFVLFVFFAGCFLILISQVAILSYTDEIQTVTSTPSAPVALIFGAGVKKNGEPSDALHDRVETGVDLYHAGKVRKIIMTGDNGTRLYNEVVPMRELAKSLGVPEKDIILDYAGFRTYDSCYRARYVFGVTSTIAVSQAFHLPRILFTCRTMGVHAEGVAADKRLYLEANRYWPVREFLARLKAFVEVSIIHPKSKFLGRPETEWQLE